MLADLQPTSTLGVCKTWTSSQSALSMIGVHMPYTSIEDCRKYAVVCEREAAQTSDPRRKETMLELAQHPQGEKAAPDPDQQVRRPLP
jgi:hypothetical protein